MDVDATSFPSQLLGMLTHISEAEFVSFDLELSGIATRMAGAPRARERQTLEGRYLEVKQAAERYQILQVGITTVKFDYVTNKYVLRPYNVNLSPLVGERLDIERDITFQAGAVEFLLKNGFQMDLPFTKGVQYLSRYEADRAKEMAYNRLDKKNVVEDLQLREEDVDSLDFVRRVREAIIKWKSGEGPYELCITTFTGLEVQPSIPAISRFEKRLVHQLVRAEFSELVSIPRPDMIRIIHYDEERERVNTRKIKDRVKRQIATQSGFRWVIEALAQGDLHAIDPLYFARDINGMIIAVDAEGMRSKFGRTTERIKSRQPVLVGHNMFTDLVYLYQSFIGPLPATLQEFQREIHELFPKIVDTKYLATYGGGDLNASPTLQEIAESLNTQPLPEIVTDANHDKYHDTEAHHEAGYDSLLTATIMLRLSAKLKVATQKARAIQPKESHDSFQSAVEHQDFTFRVDLAAADEGGIKLPAHPRKEQSSFLGLTFPFQLNSGASEQAHEETRGGEKKRRKRDRKKAAEAERTAARRFASSNLFEKLGQLSIEDEEREEEAIKLRNATNKTSTKTSQVSWEDEPYVAPGSADWVPIETRRRDPMELMPDFGVDGEAFWKEFGNRVRTFGTEEKVMKISEWPEQA
ncbi:ribonuclease H-like domain-containing protein [Lophiotrema nucula]|uniref:Ribonuclease H-like domain-containing protein n=1 Tax=Lophiotrema nucula TaxID=690887 RepID=A0A6A5YG84_9PLEO|nr:ribonuclease H-like domain-containing protein [Lophiotrema nucula]